MMIVVYRFSRPNDYRNIPTKKVTKREAKRFMKYFYRAYKVKLHMSEVDTIL